MTTSPNGDRPAGGYLAPWNAFFGIAGVLIGIFGAFALPPPGENAALPLARFVVAVVIGLTLIPTTTWNSRRLLRYWVGATVALLVVSLAALAYYWHDADLYTRAYGPGRVVIGTHMLPAAIVDRRNLAASQRHPISETQLILESGGRLDTIWPTAEIDRNAEVLEFEYVATMAAFGILMVALLQSIALSKVAVPGGSE